VCKLKIKCKWSWATQEKYGDTVQTHKAEIKKVKVRLDLKLIVGAKATRTSAGCSGSKRNIKESKVSCPVDGERSNKNIQGKLIHSVSFASVLPAKVYCQPSRVSAAAYS